MNKSEFIGFYNIVNNVFGFDTSNGENIKNNDLNDIYAVNFPENSIVYNNN